MNYKLPGLILLLLSIPGLAISQSAFSNASDERNQTTIYRHHDSTTNPLVVASTSLQTEDLEFVEPQEVGAGAGEETETAPTPATAPSPNVTTYRVNVHAISETDVKNYLPADQKISLKVAKDKFPGQTSSDPDHAEKAISRDNKYLIIWFESVKNGVDDGIAQPYDVGVTQVFLFSQGVTFKVKSIDPYVGENSNYNYILIDLNNELDGGNIFSVGNEQPIQISVDCGKKANLATSNMKMDQNLQGYGWDLGAAGFWIPVGLFGTDFNSTASGIGFAPMPINIALGTKWYLMDKDYLGFSTCFNWTVNSGQDSNQTNTNQNVNLLTGTAGLLLDFDNYIYLGAGKEFNFEKGSTSNNKVVFFLGFATNALSFLNSGKTSQ